MSDRQNQTPAEMEAAIEDLKRQITTATQAGMQRIACDPKSIEQGLAKLVLGLIELLRQLLERKAVRRLEGGSLTDDQVANMGQALMQLEEKSQEIAA